MQTNKTDNAPCNKTFDQAFSRNRAAEFTIALRERNSSVRKVFTVIRQAQMHLSEYLLPKIFISSVTRNMFKQANLTLKFGST